MANRTRCWIFDLKLYLFKIYMRTQPWAVLMHNFNLNVSLCVDLIRTVFSPIFIALILKGIWTKRNKDILMVHMAGEGNIVIVLKKNPNKMILFLYLVYQTKSPHKFELWSKRSDIKDEQRKSPANSSVPRLIWLDSWSRLAQQPDLSDGRAAEFQPPSAVMFWTCGDIRYVDCVVWL